jgi:superfamily I DNA/RNA helicase
MAYIASNKKETRTMTPTPEQEAAYSYIKKSTGNLALEAVAGSGKTTTIVNSLDFVKGKTAFIAFNKHIANELQQRAPAHVEAMTLNKFGHRICMSWFDNARFDQFKIGNLLRKIIDEVTFWRILKNVERVISILKASMILEDIDQRDINQIINQFELVVAKNDYDKFIDVCQFIWRTEISTMDRTSINFDDQIYLPILFNMPIPKYETTFIDEAQDMNIVQVELLKRIPGRKIAVGDPNQAIYGFRGAASDAFGLMQREMQMKLLPLDVCFRCGKNIIKAAQEFVPHIRAHENAIDGDVHECTLDEFHRAGYDSKDTVVLCRTTAPLVKECMRLVRSKQSAYVKGHEIGKDLNKLADKIFRFGYNSSAIWDHYGKMEKILRNKPTVLEHLSDQCEMLDVLIEDNESIGQLKRTIGQVFKDDGSGLMFCTVHRSKGLEAKVVYILRPDLMPHPKGNAQEERNLKYVAITRAKERLIWVNGK